MFFAEEPSHFNVQHPADSKRLIPALLPRDEHGHQFVVYAIVAQACPAANSNKTSRR